MNRYEQRLIKSLVRNSSHPLSRNIYDLFSVEINEEINDFEELPGKGIKAIVNDNLVQIGSKIIWLPVVLVRVPVLSKTI